MNLVRWEKISEQTQLADLIRIINRRMVPAAQSGAEECPDYCGNGSPEGVVTAIQGSEYMQWDAGATEHGRWKKFSNAGNTGWRKWEGLAGASGASATGYRIGDGSVATGDNSLAFGEDEDASNDKTISIGNANAIAADAAVTGCVVMGFGNTIATDDVVDRDVVIGNTNAVEHFASDPDNPNIVYGSDNIVNGDGLQVFGSGNETSEDTANGPLVGLFNYVNAVCFTLIGHGAYAGIDGEASIANATVVGAHANAIADSTTAIGATATVEGEEATALGADSWAKSDKSTGLGYHAYAKAVGSTAVGTRTLVDTTETGSIALGAYAVATATKTLRIGSTTYPIDTVEIMTSGGLVTLTLP